MKRLVVAASWEIRQMWRDGRMRVALVSILALFAIAFAVAWQQQQRYEDDVRVAAAADRRIWESQGALNPHSVAHFGQYAFKPAGPLMSFDPGMTPWLGTALWMEAHYQNTAAFRAVEDRATPSIVTVLSPAFVLLYLAPLLLIFKGHALVSQERERHTLRISLANGASLATLVGGKLIALMAVATLLLAPAFVPVLLADSPDTRARALLIIATYAVFLATVCAMVVAVSALSRTARTSLIALLCGWAAMALVIPRVGALAAEHVAPSVDAGEFWRDIRVALDKGLNGHETGDAREQRLLQKTLTRYSVAREEDLPVSFAGISLQAGEEHGNEVFDHFYHELKDGQQAQREALRVSGVLSPWMATAGLSMAFAGTDAGHHWHYARAAEEHRRTLQRYLNGVMTEKAKGKDFDFRADPLTWRTAPIFSYETPALDSTASSYRQEASLLAGWLLLAFTALLFGIHRLKRDGALT